MSDTPRVLVVEDEWLIAQDIASELRAAGYPVVGPVSSVAAALQLVEADKIDVALLDIQLNGETSLPIAEVLLARGTPFAFVTGFGERDVPAPFRNCKFVAKPATEATILTAVADLASLRAAKTRS
ncbi:response regulator [Mesorhizobium sp. WSM4312]|uniref:response regulator n=1 Tax=unclassified Mesorhizobium TaxID=325217 RepID=UPI000BB040E3|nr:MULTISPECIES: response regulator [unclassified Mesorhizobium]PBB65987.1 response regulator [Mesorhizobium sp. WSM4312]PBC19352.1 response regulator [Mesorhizobium sp. WSM4311]TRC77734.1 response regulator [Mesorhizobium sp. WSM4310]TRC78128.1 response regulator [Mesorhizobium sp. WSM4315]TRC79317.1 response regulator [Mesorhizobium sp. WSM4307]